MTRTIYKLDQSGHGTVATWGADAESRQAGAAAFSDLMERGFTLFDVTDPLAGRKLEAFDPEAGEIIAVPRMVGVPPGVEWRLASVTRAITAGVGC